MRFRPCIDLHEGRVKQIIGATLTDDGVPHTHFDAGRSPGYYAQMYRRDNLAGGHVIMLGPGNEAAAMEALAAYPGGLQVGGGIDGDSAARWLRRGASHVILTSYIFHHGQLQRQRLDELVEALGREHLVLDLSCAWRDGAYVVMTDRWQRQSGLIVDERTLRELASSCAEFLIHGTSVEGRQQGIDTRLVTLLGDATPIPTTYAGGVCRLADVDLIERLGQGRLDYTVGSALDIFGGRGVTYAELVARHRATLSS